MHRWSFKTKEQRRCEHDKDVAQKESCCLERDAAIAKQHTSASHGGKDPLRFTKSMQALFKHPVTFLKQIRSRFNRDH